MRALRSPRFRQLAVVLTRVGLAAGFLSGIADRFGLWGRHGAPNVSWGDFQSFVAYMQTLFPFLSAPLALVVSWVVTTFEAGFALALLIGARTRTMALGAGCLLFVYALATMFSPAGLHAALGFALLGAATASMLLAAVADDT